MEKMIGAEVGAIILAGGNGTRLGALGQTLPKCLLPLPDEQTLLTRLIEQLRESGIWRIAVCCSPTNVRQIYAFLEGYRNTKRLPREAVEAVECASCRMGPLPALAEVLSRQRARLNLICLGDIHFADAPFSRLLTFGDVDGCLITGTYRASDNGPGTGWVACTGSTVRTISYQAFDPAEFPAEEIRRWSGAYLFGDQVADDLYRDPELYRETPLENWIRDSLARGARLGWINGGSFVNVNSQSDYRLLKPVDACEAQI